jgi:deazaflavin-dependent oxidoreductase (nitroreductase family)
MIAKDVGAKLFTGFHRAVYKVSGGRIGGTGLGMPVVILTTKGRKSGQARETMLTAPVIDGDTVVLVASYGGDDRNPAWYLNLRDEPEVELVLHNEKKPMKARVANADEKAELWPRVVEANKGYAGYQEKTDREIPLVLLDPR